MRYIIFSLFLVFASLLQAQEETQVRISFENQGIIEFSGSGTVIRKNEGNRYCIISAHHVIDGSPIENVRIHFGEIVFKNVKVLKFSQKEKLDFVLLECDGPENFPVAEIYQGKIDHLLECEYICRESDFNSDCKKKICLFRFDLDQRIIFDGIVYPGDSGGGIFIDGKLVGVIQAGLVLGKVVENNVEKLHVWPILSYDMRDFKWEY